MMYDSFRTDIGSFIRKSRKEKFLSGSQLGILLNVSQQQVSRYEKGVVNIGIDKLNEILIVLDKDWSDFFFEVIAKHSKKMADSDWPLLLNNHYSL
ncbi:helix-turn-helix transcriptional regulator [Providencia rettgeri]